MKLDHLLQKNRAMLRASEGAKHDIVFGGVCPCVYVSVCPHKNCGKTTDQKLI